MCACAGSSRLAVLMGDEFFSRIAGKVIVDFGCGEGVDAVEMTVRGAGRVIGIDIREDVLQTARQRALRAGVQNTCVFASLASSQQPWCAAAQSNEPSETGWCAFGFHRRADQRAIRKDRLL